MRHVPRPNVVQEVVRGFALWISHLPKVGVVAIAVSGSCKSKPWVRLRLIVGIRKWAWHLLAILWQVALAACEVLRASKKAGNQLGSSI